MSSVNRDKAWKYLTMVNRKGKTHMRHLTYRERWYKKHGLKNPRLVRSDAEDSSASLQEHDEAYHDGRYEEGKRCKFREALKTYEKPDTDLDKAKSGRPSWVTPEMDAEYAEAFEAFEDAERRHDTKAMCKTNRLMTSLLEEHARHAFAKSVVKNDDGSPKVLYHGTEKGGFTVFDTDGEGKTKDTGAWFTDMMSNAKSYSGRSDDVQFPRITEGFLRDNNYLYDSYAIIKADGTIDQDSVSSTEKEVRDWADGALEEGERIAKVYSLEDGYGNREEFLSPSEAVDAACHAQTDYVDYDLQDQSCIYSVYVNMTNPEEIDAHEDNWDEIKTEYQVYQNGEFVDGAYTNEDAEKMVERLNESEPDAEYEIHGIGQSTDELVREVRKYGAGQDGFIIRNCSDGGHYGYCNDITTDYIVFDPRNIKMADMVTFDDHGELIPLSRRFDFTKDDVRY